MRIEILEDIDDDSRDNEFKVKLNRAKWIYLGLVYPYNPEIDELPNERAKDWQTRCAIELYRMQGEEDVASYSENGLQIVKSKAGLSKDLLSDLPPSKAGVPQ